MVATPAHSGVVPYLTYQSERALAPGSLVRVPLGAREVLGIAWGEASAPDNAAQRGKTKSVIASLDGLPPLDAVWRELVAFAAKYYQRSIGEVALSALPPQLREIDTAQLARKQRRQEKRQSTLEQVALQTQKNSIEPRDLVALHNEQVEAITQFFSKNTAVGAPKNTGIDSAIAPQPALLFGATGSGKTEVYLRCVQEVLANSPDAQVLVMVPEINLTPQLEARFRTRFAHLAGAQALVSLHSGMTPAQRLTSWLAAHMGVARIILGTRMAVFASMPALRLIIVDEEHDASYKAQDGARHSARDLAVLRAKLCSEMNDAPCRVMLGSATPSLESWQACLQGRYQRLSMPTRVGNGANARVRVVDMRQYPKKTLFAPALLAAILDRVAKGEQSLIFLNRRGYAPVLACDACGWKAACPHCSAFRVFHKTDRTLRCHHCGLTERVPRACPDCGNIDIAPIGRGTEKLEEQLATALGIYTSADAPGLQRPDGSAVIIARMDADTTRLKGSLEVQLAQMHRGEVDILVGTQMVAKGHDFRRITLVAAVNPDSALFSSDFRAPERLFSLLMQAAGRAGRDATLAGAQMWVQTYYPEHALFTALKANDYPGFAADQLRERAQAGLPPSSYQALIRAEARSQEAAQAFLHAASHQAGTVAAFERVTLYPAVPMAIARIANVERAQMLVESHSRTALQKFLSDWQPILRGCKTKGLIRWAMDVDPLAI